MLQVVVAYIGFILYLALPELIGGLLSLGFVVGGIVAVKGGVQRDWIRTALGAILILATLLMLVTLSIWTKVPPNESDTRVHQQVYETYKGITLQRRMMR